MSNKTANTIIFMLVATVLNLVLLIVFFIIGFLLLSLVMNAVPNMGEGLAAILVLLVFIFAIGMTFFIYNRLIKWATVKYNLNDKLAPLFSRKAKK